MFKILSKQQYSEKVFALEVEAPLIARSARAGNFIIIRVDANSERVPYTIAEARADKGSLLLVIQEVGLSSTKLCEMNVGDEIHDIVGPLGTPSHIENYGTIMCVGGGIGIAAILPILTALKKAGNRVISVLGGRTAELVIMQDEVAAFSDRVVIMTDDGSLGDKGVVTVGMEKVFEEEHVDKVLAIGPPIMMKFCSLTAKKHGIPNDVSLNTIMVDGTGMCGACRLTIGGKTRFVCIDGPEFNGDEVDWDEMFSRISTFKDAEREEMDHYEEHLASHTAGKQCPCEEQPTGEEQPQQHAADPIDELIDRGSAWRDELRKAMKGKERTSIERVKMPELDADYRATTRLEEVNCGLTPEMAVREAHRCIDCPKPTCVEGCPVNIQIPAFVKNIERGEFLAAARVLRHTSALPAVCGRVCPQEKQCESRCIHHKMGSEPVAIGYLERFAADYERTSQQAVKATRPASSGHKVAIVGSGPAGLSCAGDLAAHGFEVTVFEALHEIGGVLKYGIPEFRLPNRIVDAEIEALRALGVTFQTDVIVGKTISIDELQQQGFEAVFVGSGAGLPNFMGIEGENAINILSSNEYLTRVNLMDAANPATDTPMNIGRKVIVVGGGNTAMDSARTARRLGAEVTLVYRRSEAEMPARLEEVKHAKEEGIRFLMLHNPQRYLADEKGRVRAAVLDVMQLGEPDASGRRRPEATGQTIELECDQVVVAVGVSPNPLVPKSVEGLELGRKNTIAVDEKMQSSIPTIFAGGDIVRGGATVILAMGDGRRAAQSIRQKLCASES